MQSFEYTLDVDAIPTAKVLDITPEAGSAVKVMYACPDDCWQSHHKAWIREMRNGNKSAPEPMPTGHCMFEDPAHYGMIPYGCTDPAAIRAAHEAHVRSMIVGGGWTRGMDDDKVNAIVQASVDARINGENIGIAPYMACVSVWLDA